VTIRKPVVLAAILGHCQQTVPRAGGSTMIGHVAGGTSGAATGSVTPVTLNPAHGATGYLLGK
jgi:hypothetical protein